MKIKVGDIVTIDYLHDGGALPPLFEHTGPQKILEILDDGGKFYSDSGIVIRTNFNPRFDSGWVKTLNGKDFNAFPDYPDDWKYPEWENAHKCHDWKNHISNEIKDNWPSFKGFQKRLLASEARDRASDEE